MTVKYDLIGDVHGCLDELLTLLGQLGYDWDGETVRAPAGRQLIFVGDLVDRGPNIAGVVTLVRRAVESGVALCVRGNHDDRLARVLAGEISSSSTTLATSLEQLERLSTSEVAVIRDFLASLPARLELDRGRLLVVHAGEQSDLSGPEQADFNVNGAATGRVSPEGIKERVDWVTPYASEALVVYGHTPVLHAKRQGQTIDIDTGCVFGGHLSALRYPEMTVLDVPARRAYATNAYWRWLQGQTEVARAEVARVEVAK